MIIGNQKPIRVIGYEQSSMTKEFQHEINKTHQSQVIHPTDFLSCNDKNNYQYIVAVSFDLTERLELINTVDALELDLITVINDTSLISGTVQPGTFVFSFCDIKIESNIGRHCIIGSQSLIGHYVKLGSNCILRPGVMITGESTVGNNCVFNMRVSITYVNIVDDVQVLALAGVTKDLLVPGYYAGTPARYISNKG